jgi:hypothetical protein
MLLKIAMFKLKSESECKKEFFGIWTSRKSFKKSCIAARGEEGEKGVPVEPGVGQADQEGHRQQEPLGPGQGDRGLHQKGVPRQGKQTISVGDP